MTGTIDPNAPIRLADIIPIAFPMGGMTVNGLRKEAGRGHLAILRMAGKDFTTLADIEEMKKICREQSSQRASGFAQPTKTVRQPGSSLIPESSIALDAARATAQRLRGNLQNTSPANSRKSRKASTGMPQR